MGENGIMVFPDAATGRSASSIDPNLLLALQNGGGFGGNGNWIWILFLWMMWQNGGFNNFRNNGGNFADLAAQMNGDTGRDFIIQALNGRADALAQIAGITNTGVETVKSGIFALQNAINQATAQVGLTAAQTQNTVLLGNANLSRQICECCCENRLAIEQQTNAIQRQAADNYANSTLQAARDFAATQLHTANNHAEDRLDVCQQTNDLKTQSVVNTQSIKDAIAAQSIMINDKFCELEKRELLAKINTQGDIITQLRGQLDNDRQTSQLYNIIAPIQAKVNEIANKQPNTVPVQYPNLVAANATPFVGQGYYPGNGYGSGFGPGFGNGFGPGVVL